MIASASEYAMKSFRGENSNAVVCAAAIGTGARTGPNVNTMIANIAVANDGARSPQFPERRIKNHDWVYFTGNNGGLLTGTLPEPGLDFGCGRQPVH